MWKFTSSVIASIGGLKKSPSKPSCSDCSDDENTSNISREEGLECPICWESFNIVENVPYVLWCGHTLCKNCVLGLQTASLNFPSKQIKVPFLISCPWCQLLSFRLVCGGNLKFPRKNFFLLWMVESLTGDRARFVSSQENHQLLCSPKANNVAPRRFQSTRNLAQTPSNSEHVGNTVERPQISLSKSLDMFIDLLSKFPLVIVFLLILFFVIPSSAIVLIVYFLLTAFFAVPSILVLYFAYPVLSWLIKEITS